MTTKGYVPLWPNIQICKDRLDYRRKYTIFSEISDISFSESEFLPSLMTCQLMSWAMVRSAGWAMGAAWSSPHLPSSFCTALKNQGGWQLMLEAEGSCCPAQWVLWSSLLLSHNGLNRHRTAPRAGQDWMLRRRWIIPPGTALTGLGKHCPAASSPVLCSESSSCGRACTACKMVSFLKNCYFLSDGKVIQNYLKKFLSTMGRKSLCNLHHPCNLSLLAVLSHQPNQYCSKTAVWWCYSCYHIPIFHCSIDRDILHSNKTLAILALHKYTYHDK